MNIFVGVPHPVTIVDNGLFDPSIRKITTDSPSVVAVLPSNGTLSAVFQTVGGPTINNVIPTFQKEVIGIDPLPEGYDIYVVSALYADIAKKVWGTEACKRLYTVSDPVYSLDGRTILGCRGISPVI